MVPDDRVGLEWLPDLEAVALGMATEGGRTDGAALMGISAAPDEDRWRRDLGGQLRLTVTAAEALAVVRERVGCGDVVAA